MRNAAKYYPGSPAIELLGKLCTLDATGGFITGVGKTKVHLTISYPTHQQDWRNFQAMTLDALVDDELVTLEEPEPSNGRLVTATTTGRALFGQVMYR